MAGQGSAPERQVNGDKLIARLRAQVGDLMFDNALKDSVIEEQDEKIQALLQKIDELAPTEGINGNQEG